MRANLILDLSMLQTTFTGELINLAKQYNVDANELMRQAIFSFNRTAKQMDLNNNKRREK